MSERPVLHVGDIQLIPLSDGECRMTQQWYVGLDFDRHPELLADDGTLHIPIGCYVVRTADRTMLLDAGLGPRSSSWAQGGELPGELARAGIDLAEIDTVVCTHLHVDHVGWLVAGGAPFFPNATVVFGAGDWQQFVAEPDAMHADTAAGMRLLDELGRLDAMEGDMVALAPGITARHTPGHTLGSYSLVLASGDARAVLLGDAVECPLQVAEPDFYIISDVDPDLAARTREALWRELEDTDTLVGAAHFPGLQFGRILTGAGRRWFG